MLKIQRDNFNNIDCIKVCMAVLVVATHANLFSIIQTETIRELFVQALAIKVPFFFTASGFLVWYKIHNACKEQKLIKLKKWISKTLRLYLVWSAIYLPYAIYGFYLDGLSIYKSAAVYLRNFLLVGQNFWSWPLWYLLGMLVAGIIIYQMVKYNLKPWVMYLIAGALALLGIAINHYQDAAYLDLYFKLFKSTSNGFFAGLPYIMLGIAIAANGVIESKKGLWGLLLCSFLIHMFGIKIATFVVIYALFSLVLQFDLPSREDNLYRNFRLTSTIVYFVHMLWIGLLWLLFPGITPIPLFCAAVLLSFMTATMAIRCKESRIVKLLFR